MSKTPDLREAQEQISILKDPFQSDKLEGLNLFAMKNTFNGSWRYSGTVKFQNGNTKGEQGFTGNDVGDVLHQMEAFISNLSKESR